MGKNKIFSWLWFCAEAMARAKMLNFFAYLEKNIFIFSAQI